jgi:hypothetical protein
MVQTVALTVLNASDPWFQRIMSGGLRILWRSDVIRWAECKAPCKREIGVRKKSFSPRRMREKTNGKMFKSGSF